MNNIKIYSVSDRYIKYLRENEPHVYSNKIESRKHTRKYIGIVIQMNGFNYYIPLSSPKNSDYLPDGHGIRKSIIPIIRIVDRNNELKGTLRISHMIPVPETELEMYDLENESDWKYRSLVQSEIVFIRKNQKRIIANAEILYNQKIKDDRTAGYVKSALDYTRLEDLCKKYSLTKRNKWTTDMDF